MSVRKSYLFVIASILLAACDTPAPAKPQLLRVWVQWGDNPQQIQALFDKYTAEADSGTAMTGGV